VAWLRRERGWIALLEELDRTGVGSSYFGRSEARAFANAKQADIGFADLARHVPLTLEGFGVL
jgi:hypothetical protein